MLAVPRRLVECGVMMSSNPPGRRARRAEYAAAARWCGQGMYESWRRRVAQ